MMSSSSNECTTSSSYSSDNDDEDALVEPFEYEQKREYLWSKVLFVERKFSEVKPPLHSARLKELGELQNDILVRKSDLYQKRSALLEIEFEARLKAIEAHRQLQIESLERKTTGERRNAALSNEYLKLQAQEAVENAINMKRKKLGEEVDELGESDDGDGDNGDEETNGYDDCDVFSFVKSEVCDTSTTSSSTESDSDTENSSIDHFSTETRLVGTPIIISELPRSIIAQDLIYFSGKLK